MADTTSKSHLPTKLSNDNYYAWSYWIQMRLRKLGVWTIVAGEESRLAGSVNHKVVKAWQMHLDLALNKLVAELSLQPSSSHSRDSLSVAYSADANHKKHDKKDITCFRCRKKGHYRNECKEDEDGKDDSKKSSKDTAAGATVESNDEVEAW
ncbi:hypothetical protein DXG01_002843 [Tephrocybe rancida]|nr:hypothetical protein DXG01_002843 [Tephrocybe rancida]